MNKQILKLASINPELRKLLIEKLAKVEHKPGDVWKTPGGKFRAMNPKGTAKTFPSQEQAKSFSKSEGKSENKDGGRLPEEVKSFADRIESDFNKLRFNKPRRPTRESAARAERFLDKQEKELNSLRKTHSLSKDDPVFKEMRKKLDELSNKVIREFDPNGEFID